MTRLIESNYHRLHALKDARTKLRRAIIANNDKELLHSICECALNVLRGNVKLSDCNKRKLRKFKRQLRTIVDKRVPLSKKKTRQDADITRKAVIEKLAALPYGSTSAGQLMPPPVTPDVNAGLMV